MWQSSKHKLTITQKKRPKRNSAELKLRRVPVELKVVPSGAPVLGAKPAPLIDARVLLSEVSELGLHLFSREPVAVGNPVAVTFEIPKRIYLKGTVSNCSEFTVGSKIISENRFDFRLSVLFSNEKEEDQQAIRDFCKFLNGVSGADLLAAATAAEAPAPEAAPSTEQGTSAPSGDAEPVAA